MNRIKMKVTLPVSVVWLTICTMLSTVHVWFYFLTGLRVASYSHISKHGITSSDGRWCFSMVKENSLTAKIQSKFPSGPSSKVSIKIKKVTKKETVKTWLNPWNLSHLEEPCWPLDHSNDTQGFAFLLRFRGGAVVAHLCLWPSVL